jgi:hypothetical protein
MPYRHDADSKYREQKDAEDRRYRDEQAAKASQELKQQNKDFMLKLYEERRPLFGEACRTAAQIATADMMADAKPAVKKFLELYYSELCLVENPELEAAMIEFKRELGQGANAKAPPPHELRVAALRLAIGAQAGLKLEEVFDVKLGDQSRKLGGEKQLETR